MVIKFSPQILKRVSIRWLPDPAYEDTDTISLNVGGYFLDLRISVEDSSLQWSRAGERKLLKQNPCILLPSLLTFQWTRIIDSLGSRQIDEAAFSLTPNGDELETGEFKKDGTLTPYEEVWRDITPVGNGDSFAWILQSSDGAVFLGKIKEVFIGMQQGKDGNFGVRKEELKGTTWSVTFESGKVSRIPNSEEFTALESIFLRGKNSVSDRIQLRESEYVIRGIELW